MAKIHLDSRGIPPGADLRNSGMLQCRGGQADIVHVIHVVDFVDCAHIADVADFADFAGFAHLADVLNITSPAEAADSKFRNAQFLRKL